MAEKKRETDAERLDRWRREAMDVANNEARQIQNRLPSKGQLDQLQLNEVKLALDAAYRAGHAMGRKEVGR